jgi:hypothetical protein
MPSDTSLQGADVTSTQTIILGSARRERPLPVPKVNKYI